MECKFVVGQKVVCIDSDWSNKKILESIGIRFPELNQVYTIRSVEATPVGIGLLLVELANDAYLWKRGIKDEPCFAHEQFKPLDERKTDISNFTQLLRPTKVKTITKKAEHV